MPLFKKLRGDTVVAREIEIDDGIAACGAAIAIPWRRGLDEPRRQMARFGEQEEADLRDVRAGSDVDEILLALDLKGIAATEVRQRAVDLFEIPRISELDDVPTHLRLRRDAADVAGHRFGQRRALPVVEELQPGDQQVVVLAERDGGTPALPALRTDAAVELGSEETEDDELLRRHSG